MISNNNVYYIEIDQKKFKCQIGLNGMVIPNEKIEGDKKTPMGKWQFNSIYYREDKIDINLYSHNSSFEYKKITKNCGWCDDVKSKYYNQYVSVDRYKDQTFSFENLWRHDDVYDIIIVSNYNSNPIIKNKGSAIFLHCSFQDLRSTAGCIALEKSDLIHLISKLTPKTHIIF